MLFNGGVQMSGVTFKDFVGVLPKSSFFLLFKVLISLVMSLTSLLEKIKVLIYEIFWLMAKTLGWLLKRAASTGSLKPSESLS